MREVDQNILDAQLKHQVIEEMDPVLPPPPKPPKPGEETREEKKIFSDQEIQVLKDVEDALNASSGVRKVLKGLYAEGATVGINKDETQLKTAVRRLYGYDSDQITFSMYEQALEILKSQANELYKEIL